MNTYDLKRKEARKLFRQQNWLPVESLEGEIWKDVIGLEGLYMVSNFGRIKSLAKTIEQNSRWGKTHFKPYPEKLLKQNKSSNGYLGVSTYLNRVFKCMHVHRMVAMAFVENPNNLPCVNHLDGKKENNVATNLSWETNSGNVIHAYKLGLAKALKGISNSRSTPICQFDLSGKLIKEWESQRQAQREGGFRQGCINKVLKGKSKSYQGFFWKFKSL